VRVVNIRRIDEQRPLKAKTVAPLTFPLFLGFAFSCLLSVLTSVIGYGNKWSLKLPKRKSKDGKVPPGDVVIRYPKGSFLVVRCEEDVARELYFAPEAIEYMLSHGPAYRILSLIGTMMLMGGVICLANSQIQLQIAWAGAYMLLGTSYWIVAALPAKLHWDTGAYAVENECLSDSSMTEKGYPSHNQTFTQALWKTIVLAKGIEWVHKSNACPDTDAWRQWLRDARDHARSVSKAEKGEIGLNGEEVVTWRVPEWNPQKALADLLNEQAQRDEKALTKEGIQEV
jgi:hypothetical protein